MTDKKALYFYMLFVTVGTVLIALAIIKYILLENDPKGYLLLLLGFVLIIHYILYLEKKAGINPKLISIRNTIYTFLVITLTLFLYFF